MRGASMARAWRACAAVSMMLMLLLVAGSSTVSGLGVNWGTISINPLPPGYVVKMLQANGFTKVKLFDADYNVLRSMAGTGIEVMVAAPNDMLYSLANDPSAAAAWVQQNVTQFTFSGGVNIKWVAVGNEPFLTAYNNSYLNTTLPALRNMQAALVQAGHTDVRAIVPFNADVLDGAALPSTTQFKPEYMGQILPMLQLLNSTGAPFSINLYPFISKYQSASYPLDYAFFDGTTHPLFDGAVTYTNSFDASVDGLIAALAAAGFPNMPVILGEIGWPTDGTAAATVELAGKFNQELIAHIQSNVGTPRRPNTTFEFYLFSLLDENAKSIAPGPFERHWGLFFYDGVAKYPLNLKAGTNLAATTLTSAQYPPYMPAQYCVLNPSATDLTNLTQNVAYACSYGDCTSLYTGSTCASLTSAQNASYAFNTYFQFQNQNPLACDFQGLGTITTTNPSSGNCRFIIGLVKQTTSAGSRSKKLASFAALGFIALFRVVVVALA